MSSQLQISTNPQVESLILSYPKVVSKRLLHLRNLIFEVAAEIDGLQQLEETLKWGEPSYITKKGSTLRMDWKTKNPGQFAMYFSCSTKLVSTFKEVFGSKLKYEGNRAVVFKLDEELPESIIRECVKAALTYKKVKDKNRLGIEIT